MSLCRPVHVPDSHGSPSLGQASAREARLRLIFCEPVHFSLVALKISAVEEGPQESRGLLEVHAFLPPHFHFLCLICLFQSDLM